MYALFRSGSIRTFMQWYLLLILSAIAIDYFLHRFSQAWIGRYLGPIGTGLLMVSFYYSLRKRNFVRHGSPVKLLQFHEYAAWGGSVLLIVHGGIHFNAILPWLALIMMLVNVGSGLIGKILLKQGGGVETAVASENMNRWRIVHLPVALIFAVLAVLHIITILLFIK